MSCITPEDQRWTLLLAHFPVSRSECESGPFRRSVGFTACNLAGQARWRGNKGHAPISATNAPPARGPGFPFVGAYVHPGDKAPGLRTRFTRSTSGVYAGLQPSPLYWPGWADGCVVPPPRSLISRTGGIMGHEIFSHPTCRLFRTADTSTGVANAGADRCYV